MELKLGEFQDVDALTHSEAALVINALVQKRSADRKNVNETEYVFLFLVLLGIAGGAWGEGDDGERRVGGRKRGGKEGEGEGRG